MRRLTGVLAVLGLVLGVAPEANATLTVTGSSGAVLFEGLVDYTTTTRAASFPNRESTIIGKTISSLGPSLLDVTYANGDSDFTPTPPVGFRWSERILNSTGQAWSGFTVDLLTVSGNFSTTENAPYRAAITNCCPLAPLSDPQVTETSVGTTVTVSLTTVSFSFSVLTSVPAGGFLEIYIPMENLPFDSEFLLRETPTVAVAAVPEPGTLFLIGAGLAGLGIFERKRLFCGADV